MVAHHSAQLLQGITHRHGANDAIAESRIYGGDSSQVGFELKIMIEISFWIEVNARNIVPMLGQFVISLGKLDVDMNHLVHEYALCTSDWHD